MMAAIRTCVLGTGLSALTFQIPFILALPDLFSLHAVLERNPKSEGGRVKDRFGVTTKIYRTLEDVLADKEIELVVVSTPSMTHYEYAKRCLEAGKHVLLEKPVAHIAAEARELGQLAKSKKLVLYAYQNRRWDSDFQALKGLLNEPPTSANSIGDVVEIETRFDRFKMELKGTWKDENLPANGLTYDLGTHLIDQIVSLFGRPAKVTGFAENLRQIGHSEVDDSFTTILRYPPSEARKYALNVVVRGTMLSVRDPQFRYVVRGTKGTFIKYGVDIQEDQLRHHLFSPQDIYDAGFGREPEAIWGELEVMDESGKISKKRWPSSAAGSYIELFKNLAGVIRHGDEENVKWDEVTTVLEIIEASLRSSKEECTISLV